MLTQTAMTFFPPRLLFYVFAVSMILLRPFLTYEMTMQGKINNVEAVSNLFQRLVKKKDNHAEDFIESTDLIQISDNGIILPLLFIVFLRRKTPWLMSLLGLKQQQTFTTVFQVTPAESYHQRISRLQI